MPYSEQEPVVGGKPLSLAGIITVLVWVVLVAGGMSSLAVYSHTPGPRAEFPPETVAVHEEHLGAGSKSWTLVVAIHPKCPCTLATVAELGRLMAATDGKLACVVYAYAPADDPGFAQTQLVQNARAIPGVSVVLDLEAREATAAGLLTSGSVLLLDHDRAIRFHGGITAARGHEGDSLGAQAIRSLVSQLDPQVTQTPVYGCQIKPHDRTQ